MAWQPTNQAALQQIGINVPVAAHIYINQNTVYTDTYLVFVQERNHLQIQFHFQNAGAWEMRQVTVPYANGNNRQMDISMRAATDFLNLNNPPVPSCYGLLPLIAGFVQNAAMSNGNDHVAPSASRLTFS